VGADSRKQKLGDYLFDNVRSLSKMYLRELIKTGKCEVNGSFVNSGYRLRERDFIEVEADLSRGTAMQPENILLDIVFEDAEIVVVNKPSGMLVHPSHRDKNGTLLNALSFHLNKATGTPASLSTGRDGDLNPPAAQDDHGGGTGIAGKMPAVKSFIRPGLPHRLDKQTSGLIVVAKTARAHRVLTEHFMRRRVDKLYLALVDGVVETDEGTIEAPIGRFAEIKHWSVKEDGKLSETGFRVRDRYAHTTLLELEPVTGRTNQLRIHCEAIGHPIVGDTSRGGSPFRRLCLHAYKLAFPHPINKEMLSFESPVSFHLS
jgi:23S rRNA pseudouridine1911/1915/1917 synthase